MLQVVVSVAMALKMTRTIGRSFHKSKATFFKSFRSWCSNYNLMIVFYNFKSEIAAGL